MNNMSGRMYHKIKNISGVDTSEFHMLVKYYMSQLKTFFTYSIAKDLTLLLIYDNFHNKKLETFKKMKKSQKKGFLSKYIMKLANKYGVPKIYIDEFHNLKREYNHTKMKYSKTTHGFFEKKVELANETHKLIIAILERIVIKSNRQAKIEKIFNVES